VSTAPDDPTPLGEALRDKRFGLVLSAGYFGFFGHAGLVAALEETELVPAAWAGTSAGALVGAMGAVGMSSARMRELFTSLRREDFWDPAPLSMALDVARGRKVTGILRGKRFRSMLEAELPVQNIEDAAKPLLIVTSDVTSAAPRVHVRGPLAAAIHASCAYPGLFETVDDDLGRQLWDGGLVDKAPLVALFDHLPTLDAIVVMYLAGDTKQSATERPRRHGYVSGLAQGLAAIRHEHYVLQARLCEARGVPIYELNPTLTRLGPTKLALGKKAFEESKAFTRSALGAAASEHRPYRITARP
jgi:NTE family protein